MSKKYQHHYLFNRTNFVLVAIGLGLMLLGMLAMIGGGYTDPMNPNYDSKYGFQRTTLAPMLILLGLVVNGFAIMKRPSQERIDTVTEDIFVEEKAAAVKQKAKAASERAKSVNYGRKKR